MYKRKLEGGAAGCGHTQCNVGPQYKTINSISVSIYQQYSGSHKCFWFPCGTISTIREQSTNQTRSIDYFGTVVGMLLSHHEGNKGRTWHHVVCSPTLPVGAHMHPAFPLPQLHVVDNEMVEALRSEWQNASKTRNGKHMTESKGLKARIDELAKLLMLNKTCQHGPPIM